MKFSNTLSFVLFCIKGNEGDREELAEDVDLLEGDGLGAIVDETNIIV